jgi:hypothetical protein
MRMSRTRPRWAVRGAVVVAKAAALVVRAGRWGRADIYAGIAVAIPCPPEAFWGGR